MVDSRPLLGGSQLPRSRTVLKRQRQTEVRRVRNKSVRSELSSRERKVRTAADAATAKTEFRGLQKDIDRAAAQGVIHKNKASRKKSRLAKQANKKT
jgi:small subunit ribosomal protein S20